MSIILPCVTRSAAELQQSVGLTLADNGVFDTKDVKPGERVGLNCVRQYGRHRETNFVELVQNWRDRCYECNKMRDPSVQLYSGGDETKWDGCVFFSTDQAVLGYLLQVHEKEGQIHVLLVNFSTTLQKEILRFGHTSKKDEHFLAGHFGEGMKGTINRLCDGDAQVFFLTGKSQWTFKYDADGTLVAAIDSLPHHLQHTYVVVQHARKKWAIRSDQYLFLESPIPESTLEHRTTSYRLCALWDTKHQGRTYLHGIYVRSRSQFLKFLGVDYHGPIAKGLELGQDRSGLNEIYLVQKLFQMAVALCPRGWPSCAYDQKYFDFLEHIFNSLAEDQCPQCFYFNGFSSALNAFPSSFNAFLSSFDASPSSLKFNDIMVDIFVIRFGTSALPVPRRQVMESMKREAELLQVQIVELPEDFVELLEQSSKCPKMASFRRRFSVDYMKLPEYFVDSPEDYCYDENHQLIRCEARSWSDVDKAIAEQLLDIVNALFASEGIHPRQIRFKDFTSIKDQNPRPIVTIQTSSKWFLIDLYKFNIDTIHDTFLSTDPDFMCSGTACGCLQSYFIDEFLNAAFEHNSSIHNKIQRRIQRMCLGSLNPVTMPRAERRSPSPEIGSTRAETPPISDTPPADTATRSTTATAKEQPSFETPDPEELFMEQENEDYLRNAAQATKNSNGAQTTEFDTIFYPPKGPSVDEGPCECSPTMATWRHASMVTSLPYNVQYWIDTSKDSELNLVSESEMQSDEHNVYRQSAVLLSKIIVLLLQQVFGALESDRAAPGTVFIYCEKSKSVAFNKGGKLFFNAAYVNMDKSLRGTHIENPLYGWPKLRRIVHFWYITVAHELAHNIADGHNKEHEWAEEQIINNSLRRLILCENSFKHLLSS